MSTHEVKYAKDAGRAGPGRVKFPEAEILAFVVSVSIVYSRGHLITKKDEILSATEL